MDLMLVLESTHLTLRAEKILATEGIEFRAVMKPRAISSDCGLALRVREDQGMKALEFVAASGIVPARLYREEGSGWLLAREMAAAPGRGEDG